MGEVLSVGRVEGAGDAACWERTAMFLSGNPQTCCRGKLNQRKRVAQYFVQRRRMNLSG